MRCPSCDARNPDEADWCTQCFARLRPEPEPDHTRLPVDDVVPEPDASPVAVPATGVEADDAGELLQSGGGRFRRHEGEIEWRCEVCQSWNLVGLARCTVCGAGMDGPSELAPVQQRASSSVVLLLSALLPGAGHAALGQMATAWARGLTYLLWVVGGTALLVTALGSGESALPGMIPLLGAMVLWAVTLLDVQSLLAYRTRQILDARVFLWLVVGVVGLLMLTFMATFSRVGSGSG